ncbi:MAG TPA: ABC transporter permease [Vicinamibacterales bacterium]|nr:ABC transporter permease [Vicinamibacterales bacterium]
MSIRTVIARIASFFRRRQLDDELDEEVRTHLELLAADYERRGMTRERARAAARRAFGGIEQMKEVYRDRRGFSSLNSLSQDVRYAARALFRNRTFTVVAVLSLALGIGATTAVFSVINAMMIRPLVARDPGQLVVLSSRHNNTRFLIFNPEFEELRARQRSLIGVFAVSERPFLRAEIGSAAPVYLAASLVSGDYFDVLGITASQGRLLRAADDVRDGPCIAVISDSLWRRRFSRSADVVGTELRIQDRDCLAVGIAPEGFTGHQAGSEPDLWLPLRPMTEARLLASQTSAFFSGVMGRLRPGVTREQAEGELTALYRQIQALEPPLPPQARQPPPANELRIDVAGGASGLGGLRREFGQSVMLMFAAVVVVLIIASANVASLLIARGVSRAPEISIRVALGAGRWRIVRQLATEGAVLALVGDVVGMALATLATPRLTPFLLFTYAGRALDVSPDYRVVLVAGAASMIVAVVVGLIPALRISRPPAAVRATVGERATDARGNQRVQRTLLVVQFALSLLLVTVAGLLLRSVAGLSAIDLGFDSANVVMLEVADEASRVTFGEEPNEIKVRRAARYRGLEERLAALPGVQAASLSWLGLFSMQNMWLPLVSVDNPQSRPEARVDFVSSRYFDVVGMTVVRGRGFTVRDTREAPRVMVVNEALVRERFGGREALGSRLILDYPGEQGQPFTVVGVVRDSHYNSLRETQTGPMAWMSLAQAPFPITSISLRVTPGTEGSITREASRALSSIDPLVMVRRSTTLDRLVQSTVVREQFLLNVSSSFGLFAMLLAALGLHGTLAYAVARRRREFGIRLALGAQRRSVVAMFLYEAVTLTGVAVIIGVPLALLTGSMLNAFLFGVAPQDPATVTVACGVLGISALVATSVPAIRASRIDPAEVLRSE